MVNDEKLIDTVAKFIEKEIESSSERLDCWSDDRIEDTVTNAVKLAKLIMDKTMN